MSTVRIRQFDISDLNLGQIKLAAINGKIIALVNAEQEAFLLDMSGEEVHLLQKCKLNWQPKSMQMSPSSRYILMDYKYQFFELWDSQENYMVRSNFAYHTGNFVEDSVGELFLVSTDIGKLDAYRLPHVRSLFSARLSCDYYRFLSFFSSKWLESESFFAIGHPKGELNDDLHLYSFTAMRSDIDKFAKEFSCYNPLFLLGRAGILSVGHYQADHVVIYHDDNGMHDDEDASDELQNLDAFRGFYIFSITDKRILQRTSYRPSMKLETGDPIFATDSNVAILGKTQADIVSKSSGRLVQTISGDCMAIDGKLKLLIVVKDKHIEILSVL